MSHLDSLTNDQLIQLVVWLQKEVRVWRGLAEGALA